MARPAPRGAGAFAPESRTKAERWWALVGWIALCEVVGISAGLATETDTTWFRGLQKPPWNPPDWLFAPVWTTLYLLMGIAAWRWWRNAPPRPVIGLFLLQLAVNFAWSFLFFSAHAIELALIDVAALAVLVAATMAAFWPTDRLAAWLLAPYLAWVGFATALNAEIARLN